MFGKKIVNQDEIKNVVLNLKPNVCHTTSGVITWGDNMAEKAHVIIIENGQMAYSIITNPYGGSQHRDLKKNTSMKKIYNGVVPSDITMIEQILKLNP